MPINNPSSAASIQGRSRGSATPTAPGAVASFTIAHGLGSTPAHYTVTPRNALSAALMYVTADATNLTITYAAAPLAGALSFSWSAEL